MPESGAISGFRRQPYGADAENICVKSHLRHIPLGVTLLSGLGLLAALLVVRLGHWSMPWPLPLLDTFALYAFAPIVGVAAVALLLRSRALLALSIAALLLFGQQFGAESLGSVGLASRTTVT